ncbi:unnamed protein product [Symbiodinium pilosum]|uniref:RRM domain-containing protein n=1 Tax=Symbiodinium pilosum TaxID=2952 RepID=A0A812SJX2_SYMPI|nr:unnamed protein product [Symbiodinium pilosum]
MSASPQKSAYTIADLSREFAGEFTEEEIQQHLQGVRAEQHPTATVSSAVFVAGLCWATTDERLYDFFESCGIVVRAEVNVDSITGRSRGFGKVTFASPDAVDRALSLHDAFLDGRPITVRPFTVVPPRGTKRDVTSFEVHVDSLSWHTDETSLRRHFADCGDILSCSVFYDRKTGQHKGAGKLAFASEAAAQRAAQRHLSDLDGWTISVRPGKAVRANRTRASADRSHHSTFVPQEWRESGGAESRGAFRDISSRGINTMDVPSMIPPTCLVDWLAELDPAGFLLCYLPILATLGHKNARDVVNKYVEEASAQQQVHLAEQLFTDLKVRKLGHRRLFERWFAGLIRGTRRDCT